MKGKTIIITGGSSGIGKACAMRFARGGAQVVIAGRTREKLQKAEADLQKIHADVLTVVADVSNPADCIRLIEETIRHFGKLDVLVNNAGISMRGLFVNTELEVIKKIMDVNFWGTVYCTKSALPHLLKTNGSIVGVSSVAGKKGLPGRTAYSASKFAMEGFLETLRSENLKNNLHILIACPGFTTSGIRNSALGPDGMPQNESPRNEQEMMSAENVADKIYHATINRKRDLVLTFNGKMIVLLNKFFPSLVDKLIYKHLSKEPGSPFK